MITKDKNLKCKVCKQSGAILEQTPMSYGKNNIKPYRAIYCVNCGFGCYSLNDFQEGVKLFTGLDNYKSTNI